MDPTKACRKCGQVKPLPEFVCDRRSSDGRAARCKACRLADKRAWTVANPEARKRHNRAYYSRHREQINAQRGRWSREISPQARERKRVRDREWKRANREKTRAHVAVAQAIQRHELIRPVFCAECRKTCRHSEIQAHHKDYSKPLDVIWLCGSCHRARHPH